MLIGVDAKAEIYDVHCRRDRIPEREAESNWKIAFIEVFDERIK